MATIEERERFARHGLARLRRILRQRFSGDLTVRDAVSKTLGDIIDEWDSREPLHDATFDLLVDAIRRPLDGLENGPMSDAKAFAEQLARAWDSVRPKLTWG